MPLNSLLGRLFLLPMDCMRLHNGIAERVGALSSVPELLSLNGMNNRCLPYVALNGHKTITVISYDSRKAHRAVRSTKLRTPNRDHWYEPVDVGKVSESYT